MSIDSHRCQTLALFNFKHDQRGCEMFRCWQEVTESAMHCVNGGLRDQYKRF